MTLLVEEKKQILQQFGKHGSDTGSAQVQIALLTKKLDKLSEHLKENTKDFHSQRGLMKLVGKRRRLLRYIQNNDEQSYKELIDKLGLRK